MIISNWGKYPEIEAEEMLYRDKSTLPLILNAKNWIPRGMGLCYGDSALSKTVVSSLKLNHFLAFDAQSGILTCESGVTFEDILNTFVPKGWFPPVTPGTKFVSMGGAIASDVHGKNHHKEGSFSRYVHSFRLLTAEGEYLFCSPSSNPEIFNATFGGMGLTGLILSLTFQLKRIESSLIKMESLKTRDLQETLAVLNEFESATYTVAWTDCLSRGKKLGRSLFLKGEHASLSDLSNTRFSGSPLSVPNKLKLSVPFNFPSFALNPFSVKAFNFLLYNKQFSKKVSKIADYDGFFYPLDSIYHWNRIYGKRGFTQYQFVIPKKEGYTGLKKIIEKIGSQKMGSFLVVLKTFGKQENQYLAFPEEGYTLAMDFAMEPRLFPFLEELDAIVLEYGGRVYLTKDARLPKDTFQKMYPQTENFLKIRNLLDPERKIRSLQSERLGI